MRIASLFPVILVAAAGLAGCGSERIEEGEVPASRRDLTRQGELAQLVVASPVELQRARPERSTVRRPRRTSRPAPKSAESPELTVINAAAIPTPAIASVPEIDATPEAVNDRELPPGKTVTIIPASSGPSMSPDSGDDDAPTVISGRGVIRGGGTCPPRRGRPGIGIAAIPRLR